MKRLESIDSSDDSTDDTSANIFYNPRSNPVLLTLLKESFSFFSNYHNPPYIERAYLAIPRLLCKLNWESLIVGDLASPISYYSLFSSELFTVCLFVLKRGAGMPIHDHPNMTVFSRLLHGQIFAKTYSTGSCILTPSGDEYMPIENVSSRTISSEDGTDSVLLIKDGQGPNLHFFRAESDIAAFIDILGPPYDSDDRTCRYYSEMRPEEIRNVSELEPYISKYSEFLKVDVNVKEAYSPTPVSVYTRS